MAKLEDVFVVEADRQEPEKWSKIHLFKMGDFWRAYEWSASRRSCNILTSATQKKRTEP